MKTLYDKLVDAGCEIDHHASDLYVKADETSKRIIKQNQDWIRARLTVSSFESNGEQWFDLPFHYEPYWRGKDA